MLPDCRGGSSAPRPRSACEEEHLVREDLARTPASGTGKRSGSFVGTLTRMRDKPRPSGRERIAPGSRSDPLLDVLQADSSRERPTAGLAGSNASGDTSSAVRHSAQESTVKAATTTAQPESPGLQAGEEVNREPLLEISYPKEQVEPRNAHQPDPWPTVRMKRPRKRALDVRAQPRCLNPGEVDRSCAELMGSSNPMSQVFRYLSMRSGRRGSCPDVRQHY